jgi:protein-tyrosine phosphatase/Fe-S-cluster containining protein
MNREAYRTTWVTDQLAVGAAPMSHAQLDCLRDQGVGAILNLCGEFCDLHDIECAAGFEVYHMPLADEEAPELAELEKALAWLDEAIYLGKKVLIHCRHGIGRTGTVLNAYLLRRGLGHKLAWFKLRTLRSKPANFAQWWTIRKYGRQSPKLTVREPSLEMHKAVDLSPFFRDYEALQSRVDAEAGRAVEMCGRDHARCCSTPIQLTMVEAVYVTQKMNVALTSEKRLEVIARAVETARRERLADSRVSAEEYCLSDADARCPLLEDGRCILFSWRPLQCRSFALDEDEAGRLWETVLAPALGGLSLELWLAFAGTIARGDLPHFALADVVSGKYVQTLFHLMIKSQ